MALQIADRVKETTTTTGTGALALAGAMTGHRRFSAVMGNGDLCFYALQAVDINGIPTGDWEVGRGTYTSSGNTLSRDLIFSSSNGGSAVSLTGGTTQVWLDVPAAALTGYGPTAGPVPAFWFDGVMLSGANGSAVPQLVSAATPISANVAPATGSTSTVGATLNGKPTLVLPGGQYSGFAQLNPINLAQATIFAVAKITSAPGAGDYPLVAGAAGCLEYRIDSNGQALLQNYTASIGSASSALSVNTWYQMNATYNASTGAYAFRQASAALASGTNSKSISANNSAIGYQPAGNNGGQVNSFTGSLAELIVYNSVLTLTQIQAIESYLNSKWGV